MLVPLSWLGRYVELKLSIEELSRRLSASGSSVERTHAVGAGLDELVVAEVLEVKPHPNADRLRVAQVQTDHQMYEVVCGAPNLAQGQHIVFAKVGALVPVNMHDEARQPFKLEQAKIRGVVSQGMICSVAELGLGEDHDGILVLPESTEVGQSISQALGYPQTVLDIEVTTNRPDELSMIGLAREVGVISEQLLQLPQLKDPSGGDGPVVTSEIDTEACYRLMTQTLSVKVGPSPWWLQQLLTLAGMRPINNVVDVTNFVMLEYGQPLHAYDLRQLQGDRLVARMAKPNELMKTLDGVERKLTESMLVIADGQGPVGIAGIMGGVASKTEDTTTEIVLEAAVFDPVTIRRAANALALRSEASKRFERGVDRNLTNQALQRAVELLIEVADARVLSQPVDNFPQPIEARHVTLSLIKLEQYLGIKFTLSQAEKILQALGFETVTRDDEVLEVRVPSWRMADVEQEEDLIEEVVRIHGYDQLPIELPSGRLPKQPINAGYANMLAAKIRLTQAGWHEAVTTSLTNQASQDQADRSESPMVAIANPLSSEWTHLRESLLPGLLTVAQRNTRHHAQLKLFELSAVYTQTPNGLPHEQAKLGLLMSVKADPEQSVAGLKGLVEDLLHGFGLDNLEYQLKSHPGGPFEPSNTAAIEYQGKPIGYLGAIQRSVQHAYDLGPTLMVELDLEQALANRQHPTFQVFPKYPAVEEDLSLIVDQDVAIGEVVSIISMAGGDILESVEYRETYRGKGLEDNQKSPLLHLTFRAPDRTLSSTELAEVRTTIQQALTKHHIQVRSA